MPLTSQEINRQVVAAGISSWGYRTKLVALAKLQTGGNIAYEMEFVGGDRLSVKGAWEIDQEVHGAQPDDWQGQARAAYNVLRDMLDMTKLESLPWAPVKEDDAVPDVGAPAMGVARKDSVQLSTYADQLTLVWYAWDRPAKVKAAVERLKESGEPVTLKNVAEELGDSTKIAGMRKSVRTMVWSEPVVFANPDWVPVVQPVAEDNRLFEVLRWAGVIGGAIAAAYFIYSVVRR